MPELTPAEKRKQTIADRQTLEQHIKWFDDARFLNREADEHSIRDRCYYDGDQLTEDQLHELRRRSQPAVVDNRIKDKVDNLLGLELSARTDPKAYPRTPLDEPAAEAATDAIRFVADNNNLDQVVSLAAESLMVEGDGHAGIEVSRDSADQWQIDIHRQQWDRCTHDPHSRELDFSDAAYRCMYRWIDADEAIAKWGDTKKRREAIESAFIADSERGLKDRDRPEWTDKQRNRLMLVSMYYQNGGDWYYCRFTLGGYIDRPEKSAYLDEDGSTRCPWVWQSAYIDRDGKRYGVVRRYIHLQDEVNKRRSKMLHLINTNQIVMEEGAADDPDELRREANKPDGTMVVNEAARFELVRNTELAQSQFLMLQQTIQAFDQTGPNAAIQGDAEGSGRSIELRQKAGVLQLGPVMDRVRNMKRSIYRHIWLCIRQFWTEERWIRVRDDGDTAYVLLNQRVPRAQYVQSEQGQAHVREIFRANPRLEALAQRGQQGDAQAALAVTAAINQQIPEFPTINSVGELNFDLILEDAPDMVNLQSEQFRDLVTLAQAGVQFPPEVYIEASAIRNKRRLMDSLRPDEPTPEQAQAMQYQQALAAAELQERQATAADKAASAQKKQAEAQGEQLENVGKAAVLGIAGR